MVGTEEPEGRRTRWQARLGVVLTLVAVVFLLFDSTGKLFEMVPVVEGSRRLGYPDHTIRALGFVLMLSVITHVVPRTAVLGAVLLTGYLGGAVATHVRVSSPLLTHVLFPVYVAVFVWGGLLLRRPRLRQLLDAAPFE